MLVWVCRLRISVQSEVLPCAGNNFHGPSRIRSRIKLRPEGEKHLAADLESWGLLCKLVKYLKSASKRFSSLIWLLRRWLLIFLFSWKKKKNAQGAYNLWNSLKNKDHLLFKALVFQSSPSPLAGHFHSEISSEQLDIGLMPLSLYPSCRQGSCYKPITSSSDSPLCNTWLVHLDLWPFGNVWVYCVFTSDVEPKSGFCRPLALSPFAKV